MTNKEIINIVVEAVGTIALEYIGELEKENEQLKEQVSYLKDNLRVARKKLFDILTDYEIGNYDNNIHQFYEDVYDVHNKLMEVEE